MSEIPSSKYLALAGVLPLLASALPVFEFVIHPYQEQIARLEQELQHERKEHNADRVRWESNRQWLLKRNTELMIALGVDVE